MSSNNASTSKTTPNSLKLDEQTREQKPPQAQLSSLEEDDEFEEFAAQDWDDSKTELANLGGANPGDVRDGDKLWEDNWDDDDVEDEFSVQLRNELAKTGQGTTGVVGGPSTGASASNDPEAMQH
ncbi:hypothetical protein BD410DRAFT_790402 [Rickenella mellea]|uniref:26S proteasome complex subunit SEM1 n=1 Tax=Rickenella mellea TaxID=50990 RepID=A0A4Y7Q0A3_9AGAM|nr:hypothetical protein BD410DRAFT_790402 [Rickenella mellea]